MQAILRWKRSCSLPSNVHSQSLDSPAQRLRMHFDPWQKHAMTEHVPCSAMIVSNQPYNARASRRSPNGYCHCFVQMSRSSGFRASSVWTHAHFWKRDGKVRGSSIQVHSSLSCRYLSRQQTVTISEQLRGGDAQWPLGHYQPKS